MRPPASDDEREVRELLAGAERPVIVPPFSSVRARAARTPLVPVALGAAVVLVIAAALGLTLRDLRAGTPPASAVPSSPSPAASGTSIPTVTPSAQASATPAQPLSERYGVVVDGRSPYLRSETDPKRIAELSGELGSAVVSPDGRKIAYWQDASGGGARVLWVVDAASSAGPRQLLTLPASEIAATSTGGGVVWSSDGTGLLIAVNSRDYVPQSVPDAAHLYATLRQVDLASGAVKEIARKEPGHPFYPLAWDRTRQISAATGWGPGGFTAGFSTIRDDGSLQGTTIPFTTLPRLIVASPDASRVLAYPFFDSDQRALYVWPLADPTQRTTLAAAASDRVVRAMWRNAREVVVSLAQTSDGGDGDRLEVWSLDGSRRVVLSARHRLDAVRPDGTAAITSKGVIDLVTGASAEMPSGPGHVAASFLLAVPSATPTVNIAVLKRDFGVIYWGTDSGFDPRSAPTIRREGETTTTAQLVGNYFNQFHGSVSPDGRRAVYPAQPAPDAPWALYLLDGSKPAEQRRLLTLGGGIPSEIPSNIVWASDGSGVALVVTDGGATQGVVPKYAAIRTLDLASGKVTELTRITDGSYYRIVGWERSSGTIAAFTVPYGSTPAPASYVVLGPGGTRTVPTGGGWGGIGSPDARTVVGTHCEGAPAGCSLWTWPLADFAARSEQHAPTGLLGIIGWRPGSNDVGLYVSNVAGGDAHVELWSAAAGRRTIHRFAEGRTPPGPLFFRADGSALFVPGYGEATVVDLTTGVTGAVPFPPPAGPSDRQFPSASIRLGGP